jgi:hypothetical protein
MVMYRLVSATVSLFVSLTRRRRQPQGTQEVQASPWRPLQGVLHREKPAQALRQARFYSDCNNAIAFVKCGLWGCGVVGYGSYPVAFDTCMLVQRVHRFCQVWGAGLRIMTSGSNALRLLIS